MGIHANRLSVRRAQTEMTPGRHADGGNLYLNVTSSGARSWKFLYKRAGRRRELGLGSVAVSPSPVPVRLQHRIDRRLYRRRQKRAEARHADHHLRRYEKRRWNIAGAGDQLWPRWADPADVGPSVARDAIIIHFAEYLDPAGGACPVGELSTFGGEALGSSIGTNLVSSGMIMTICRPTRTRSICGRLSRAS